MQRFALQAVIKNESTTGAARLAAWVGVSETVHFALIEAGQAGLGLAQKFGSQYASHRFVLGWWQSTLRCHHGASDVQAAWLAYDEAYEATEIQFNCQIPGCRRMCCSLGPLSVLMRAAPHLLTLASCRQHSVRCCAWPKLMPMHNLYI